MNSKEEILAKIRKLLALGESPNEHEARAAMAKATELMDRYAIDSASISASADEWQYSGAAEIINRTKPYSWPWIAFVLEKFFFVKCFINSRTVLNPKNRETAERHFVIFGRADQVAIAKHVFSFLEKTSSDYWNQYRAAIGSSSRQRQKGYIQGLFTGLLQTLKSEQDKRERWASRSDENAIVAYKGEVEKAYQKWQEESGIKVGKAGKQTRSEDDIAFQTGIHDGRKIRIAPAVTEGETDKRRLLECRS